jgi:hypothetical protein
MSEHNKQPSMLSAVEQEEALNAEREAREAREARSRGIKNKSYPEVCLFILKNLIDYPHHSLQFLEFTIYF